MVRLVRLIPLILATLGLTGCGESGYQEVKTPRLELEHAGTSIAPGDAIHALLPRSASLPDDGGAWMLTRVAIRNRGGAPLEVHRVAIEGRASTTLEVALVSEPDGGVLVVQPGDTREWLEITFRPERAGDIPGPGELVVQTNRTMDGETERRVPLALDKPKPELKTTPSTISAGVVAPGTTIKRPLMLLNTGSAALSVTGIQITGDAGFSVSLGEAGLIDEADRERVTLDPPLIIQEGSATELHVHYTSTEPTAVEAELLLFTEGKATPHVVPLDANANAPCISVQPSRVQFGGKVPGTTATVDVTILSCGEEPLELSGVSLGDDADDAFALGGATGGDEAVSWPVTLAANESVTVEVRFAPPALSPPKDDGLVPFEGTLVVASNALGGDQAVPLEGFGVEVECPTPIIVVHEGEEVVPQTWLTLDGTQSVGAAPITGYSWTVEQPDGSVSSFFPSASAPVAQFEANVAGLYTFQLQVEDANGESCGPAATATVLVVPDDALHIELLWTTPTDPHEGDIGGESGTDLDLHLVHPFAAGVDIDDDGSLDGYFDVPFDCFWFNTDPVWGSMNAHAGDDPRLDRDDTDGAGPENVNIASPQQGITYKVGVHYWDDHSYGPSYATLRVYVYGQLKYERAEIKMVQGDLWDALTIAWPSAEITPKNTGTDQPVIHPMVYAEEFPHP